MSHFQAPATQYVVFSDSSPLLCETSYTAHFVRTSVSDPQGDLIAGGTINQVSLDDEGTYECDFYISEINVMQKVPFDVVVFGEHIGEGRGGERRGGKERRGEEGRGGKGGEGGEGREDS